MSTLKVRVTRDDIRNGRKNDCARCPVARAVRRLGYAKIAVCPSEILVNRPTQQTFRNPQKARRFINAFDAGKPVKPFTFMAREFHWQ